MTLALELDSISKRFAGVVAVDRVSLGVKKGEFLTLLGPSGSGKTTMQRLIGGFERQDAGSIRIMGVRVDGLPPYRRDTATVFQTGALFPHKTVAENIAYGLRMRKADPGSIAEKVQRALAIVRLEGFERRYPSQLSGGQKQRVALARSIVVEPAILMFDEPLSALDLNLRLQLRGEIKRLHDELGFTAIYVTHDQSEAMAMSDRIAVMNCGRIEQIDRPERIFHSPANEFVYTFIGESCCLAVRNEGGTIRSAGGQPIELMLREPLPPGPCKLYIRPSRFRLGAAGEAQENRLRGCVSFVEYLGETYRYHVAAADLEFFVDQAGAGAFGPGEPVTAGWATADMTVFR